MSLKGRIGNIIQTPQVTFEWEINDFLSLKNGDVHDSPSFSFEDSQWLLSLCPTRKNVRLSLVKEDSGPPKTVKFWLAIKVFGGVEKKAEVEVEFTEFDNEYEYLLSRSELSNQKSILIPNGVLTVICCLSSHIAVTDTPSISTDRAASVEQIALNGEKKLQESLLSLLESKEDSDIIIKVQGKEFPAHKAILRSRSSVFHSMFVHDMVEKNSGVVKIEDCDPTVFYDFLVHVYSGSCNHICVKNVCGLYTAADKYNFSDLKQACSEFMKSNITVGCFCDIITLAMKHSDKDLTECATKFFCENSVGIVKTTEWQTFLPENSTVGNELFLKAILNCQAMSNCTCKK